MGASLTIIIRWYCLTKHLLNMSAYPSFVSQNIYMWSEYFAELTNISAQCERSTRLDIAYGKCRLYCIIVYAKDNYILIE